MTTSNITAARIAEVLLHATATGETVTISGTTMETMLKLPARALREEQPDDRPQQLAPVAARRKVFRDQRLQQLTHGTAAVRDHCSTN